MLALLELTKSVREEILINTFPAQHYFISDQIKQFLHINKGHKTSHSIYDWYNKGATIF